MSNPLLHKNWTAGAAIAAFRIVQLSAADTVIQSAAATSVHVGVMSEVPPLAGERCDVIHVGIAFVEAGAAYPLTARLTSDATGRAVAAAPGAGANVNCIGYPLDAANAAGDIVRILIAPHSFQG